MTQLHCQTAAAAAAAVALKDLSDFEILEQHIFTCADSRDCIYTSC